MGYSSWDNDFYKAREVTRKSTNTDAFAYHRTISTGKAKAQVHAAMNPLKVTRESRDSEAHPTSVAVAVFMDVTGSMSDTPRAMQAALPKLMQSLVDAGVAHPQVLFGAVGDAVSDAAPLQVGQFEAGIETDDDLGRIYMEGNGGGSMHESYQNALYFAARHTSIDCFEKRNQKGFLFLIGDEYPYDKVSKHEALSLFGDTLQADIPVQDIIKEAQEKYHVYFIIPQQTSHGRDPQIRKRWETLLGKDYVLTMGNASDICNAIIGTVAKSKGAVTTPTTTDTSFRL